jgi:uracil-DNA glycosylase
MLDLEKFEDLFSEGWWQKFKPWFETQDAFDMYQILKGRSGSGAKIFPQSNRTFRAFKLTDPKSITAIIVGLSPYHTIGKNGQPSADGLAFSNSLTEEESPSLKLFYDAIEKDLGRDIERNCDLSYLAEQGVLLLNYSLTTEYGKATIHADTGVWNSFNKFFYETVLASECGIPVLLCGKQAQTIEKLLFNMCHVIKKVEHPAAAAREYRSWQHENAFNWINTVLKQNNGGFIQIDWDSKSYNDVPWKD